MHRRAQLLVLLCLSSLPPVFAQTLITAQQPLQSEVPQKYPLRLHVLAIDDTHQTPRMQPNWCSGSLPDTSTGDSTPCSNGAGYLRGGAEDLSGAGRADLVTPPNAVSTLGLNFTYEGCSRIRAAPGFQALDARWSKPGSRLEVVIPTDDEPPRTARCTLKVVPRNFVYLRLRNGAIVRVSQEAYARKPSLRVFLSGGAETLERRSPVVSVNTLAHPTAHP